mmetsp:Transcript_32890/g.94430  ORF Transcript_32890/g.94430 Transcript_32890/m.94430 type:complete len:223 (+) Transcript_32890:745-1413(+)
MVEKIRVLAPTDTTRHTLKERVHRQDDASECFRHTLSDCMVAVRIPQEIGGALGQDQGEDVGQGNQDAEQPHQRPEGANDHVRHHSQFREQPDSAQDAHQAADPYDADELSDYGAGPEARHGVEQCHGDVKPRNKDHRSVEEEHTALTRRAKSCESECGDPQSKLHSEDGGAHVFEVLQDPRWKPATPRLVVDLHTDENGAEKHDRGNQSVEPLVRNNAAHE